MAGLLCYLGSLTSLLVYAPETRGEEWQESIATFGMEAIERMEITGESRGKSGITLPESAMANEAMANEVMANEAIAPYFEIANPELGLRSPENLVPDNLVPENLAKDIQTDYNLAEDNNDAPDFAQKEDWPEPVNDSKIYSLLLVERLEYRGHDGENLLNWEIISWIGGDYERLWIKSEGDIAPEDGDGEAEVQLLYGQLISSFWDFQAGLRYDRLYGSEQDRGRAFGIIGIQGLAPYLFELDTAIFISEDGDLSARFVAEYQLLLSQRLILQPELETNLAAQKVEEFGVGSGINDIELGVRMRYEFSRQFAPYIGINWSRKFGETADLAREEGESVDDFSVLGGMRLLF
ncbi:MAG: copper resistance protein B [Oscillatoria sp. SIO1A7]|nr:copper resistance protein B [Oscillatoria sp. SIO1A7]